MNDLIWKTGKPPKDGWYWIYDPSCPFIAQWKGTAFQYGYSYGVLADKWSGPIPLPGEKSTLQERLEEAVEPLNCDECKMQARCTCVSTDCKYPEGRLHGVTTYDKMKADKRSALEERLEEAEKVITETIQQLKDFLLITTTNLTSRSYTDAWNEIKSAHRKLQSYTAKYPKGGG